VTRPPVEGSRRFHGRVVPKGGTSFATGVHFPTFQSAGCLFDARPTLFALLQFSIAVKPAVQAMSLE
jgi:hypothetical protein